MADTTLAASTLSKTSGSPVVGTDVLRIVRSTTSYQITAAHLATYMATAMSALALSATTIELGHASDTTISRASAGRIAVEGSNVLMASDIGVTVQAYDADLAAWSALSPTLYSTTAQIAAAYQPLDADLTAWAAVNPSSYSTTSQIAAAYQPLDGDLTAIAALTTTSTGRALLTVADAAAIRTAAGLGTSATVDTGTSGATVPLLSGSNTASGAWTFTNASPITLSAATARLDWYATGDGADAKRWAALANGGIFYLQTRTDADVFGATALSITRSGTTVTAIALAATTVTINGTAIASAAFKATGTSGNTVPLLDGANTWSGNQTLTAIQLISGTSPDARMIDTDGGTNATIWRNYAYANGSLGWSLVNDAFSVENFWLTVTRTAHTAATVDFGSIVTLTKNGVAIPTISSSDTLSNKTIASPTLSGTVSVTGGVIDMGANTNKIYVYNSSAVATLGFGNDLSGASYELSVFAGSNSDGLGRISFGRRRSDTGTYTERGYISTADGSFVWGAPTGGAKGSGTANFAGDIYKNNTAFTNPDYVFEHFYRGEIVEFAANDGASEYAGLMTLEDLREFTRKNLHLPQVPKQGGVGIFERGDYLLRATEENTLYILSLHERIAELEQKLAA